MAAIVDQLSDEQLFRAMMNIIRDGDPTYLNTINKLDLNTNTNTKQLSRDAMLEIMSANGILKEQIVYRKLSEGVYQVVLYKIAILQENNISIE